MPALYVFVQGPFVVESCVAVVAEIWLVAGVHILCVSLQIANDRELLGAQLAVVRFLSRVDPQMH